MMAASYNLCSSADHRCWSVGWGAFLIKRQMSVGKRCHSLAWQKAGMGSEICIYRAVPWKREGSRGQSSAYKLLSMTDGAIMALLHLCCRYGGQPLLLWVWELQHNEGYRSMFTMVIVASKNSQTTVSPSTGTHYMKMRGWVWCSNISTQRPCAPVPNVPMETSAESVIGLF